MHVSVDEANIITQVYNVYPVLWLAFGSFYYKNYVSGFYSNSRFFSNFSFNSSRQEFPGSLAASGHDIEFAILVTQFNGKHTAVSDHQRFC